MWYYCTGSLKTGTTSMLSNKGQRQMCMSTSSNENISPWRVIINVDIHSAPQVCRYPSDISIDTLLCSRIFYGLDRVYLSTVCTVHLQMVGTRPSLQYPWDQFCHLWTLLLYSNCTTIYFFKYFKILAQTEKPNYFALFAFFAFSNLPYSSIQLKSLTSLKSLK